MRKQANAFPSLPVSKADSATRRAVIPNAAGRLLSPLEQNHSILVKVGCILWPMGKETKPHVFIIESNQWKDEQDKRREGAALAEILSLANKKTEYRYIRTIQEFKCVLKQFVDSRFRYGIGVRLTGPNETGSEAA